MSESSKWQVIFYQDAQQRLPVDDWIRSLPENAGARIVRTIGLLRVYGIQLTMPHARHVRGKIWELRTAVGRNDYRILYTALVGQQFLLLHGFSKKTPKTPIGELETAERRLADYQVRTRETKR